ncbi:MAG TPA: hypothetical protein VFK05_06520 [Polyangiaceae bacterium]|nr:hypothetical protein [Polyangiaceae bacterium]
MRPFIVIAGLALAAGGFVAGRNVKREPGAPLLPASSQAQTECSVPAPAAPIDTARLSAELRDMLRQELARKKAESEPRPAQPQPDPGPSRAQPDPAPSREQIHLGEQAMAIVTEARTQGHWSAEDRDKWLALSSDLTRDQHEDVLRAFFTALNAGELKLDFPGSPL